MGLLLTVEELMELVTELVTEVVTEVVIQEKEVVSTPHCPLPRILHLTLTTRSLWVTGGVRTPGV